MTDFEAAIRAHGLLPRGPVVPDGKWHRCPTEDHPKKRNGAWKWASDGAAAWYWNLARDSEPILWRPDREHVAPAFDPRRLDASRRQQRQRFADAARAAQAYYQRLRPLNGPHPYLERKGLSVEGCGALRVDPDGKLWLRWVNHMREQDGERPVSPEPTPAGGWLVAPMYRAGTMTSVQRIAPDGSKRFWTGGMTGGASLLLDRPTASITVIAEGLATGLAIFQAAPLTRVIVSFTASNLPRIDMSYHGLVVVAADNDHLTICEKHKAEGWDVPYAPWEDRPDWCRCNPGRIAAAEAAAVFGCGVAAPTGMDGTDWCDLRQERIAERLERWTRRPHETDATVRRAVDAELASMIARHARFVAPKIDRKRA